MIASSAKFRGHRCFNRNEFVGFDEIKPINIVIGRNNTGKSHLLDLVDGMCENGLKHAPSWTCRFITHLTPKFLEDGFAEHRRIRRDLYQRTHSNLDPERKLLEGLFVAWQMDGKCSEISNISLFRTLDDARQMDGNAEVFPLKDPLLILDNALPYAALGWLLTSSHPLHGKFFRRLYADRNFLAEPASDVLHLGPNGSGASNIFRHYLSVVDPDLPSSVVRGELLDALNEIYGADGRFLDLTVKWHPKKKPPQQQDASPIADAPARDGNSPAEDTWELHLEEKDKGQIRLSQSGSGLKTILLVLLNLLVIPHMEEHQRRLSRAIFEEGEPPRPEPEANAERRRYVFVLEELENNLHPAMFRRLLKFIDAYVRKWASHVFLTTHSSVALDVFGPSPNAQFIHVTHDGRSATATTVSAHFDHLNVLSELGAKPSDLLQANGIIWVEGPSDRIYINKWIEIFTWDEEAKQPRYREGRDYQCAFYGGALLARAQFTSPEDARDELVNLLRVNPNIAVMCDSDQADADSELKARVQRVAEEVRKIPRAHLWVAAAREVENYLPGVVIGQALKMDTPPPDPGQREDFFPSESKTHAADSYLETKLQRKSMDKMKLASLCSPHFTRELMETRFDWSTQMRSLIACIEAWNT